MLVTLTVSMEAVIDLPVGMLDRLLKAPQRCWTRCSNKVRQWSAVGRKSKVRIDSTVLKETVGDALTRIDPKKEQLLKACSCPGASPMGGSERLVKLPRPTRQKEQLLKAGSCPGASPMGGSERLLEIRKHYARLPCFTSSRSGRQLKGTARNSSCLGLCLQMRVT